MRKLPWFRGQGRPVGVMHDAQMHQSQKGVIKNTLIKNIT